MMEGAWANYLDAMTVSNAGQLSVSVAAPLRRWRMWVHGAGWAVQGINLIEGDNLLLVLFVACADAYGLPGNFLWQRRPGSKR